MKTIRFTGRRLLICYLFPGLALLLFIHTAVAQSQFGQITGLIVDPEKSSISGANITITNIDTGVKTQVTTNTDGNYTVTSLVPGNYSVAASKAGFSTVTHSGIVLQVGATAQVNMTLTIGSVSQQVTVKGAAGVLLQTETASIGNVIPQSGVVNLPLNGRDYLQLATLVPGTNSAGINETSDNIPTNNLNINGMRQSATAYVFDGADVMDQFFSGSPYTPAPDAIQEFRVETNNMTAQYGGGGAIVNVVFKSGTNRFRGNVYEFLRNDTLDARNYFALTTPELRWNMFGGTLGGPIKKNKLFFFGDYQGSRFVEGVTHNTLVPTAAQKLGNFSGLPTINDPYTGQPLPGNQIPSTSISSQAAFFLNFFPAANTPGGTYVRTVSGTTSVNQYDIRIDYHLRDSDLIAFTWSQQIGSINTPGPLPLNGGISGPNQGEFTNVNWTHMFGSKLVNQADYSYARETAVETGQGIGTNYTVQAGISGFNDSSLYAPGPPNLTIDGYSSIDGYDFLPEGHIINHYNIGDVFTAIVGRHTIELGGNARWYDVFVYNGAHARGDFTFTGTYTGNAFADFLYGTPLSGERGFPRNLFGGYARNQNLFLQDSWKPTAHFTVVGGFRWDLIHPSRPMDNFAASTNPITDQIIVSSNSRGQINTTTQAITAIILPIFQSRIVPSSAVGLPSSLVYTNWQNFAPRLGLAYQLPREAVLRAGYGIFYPLEQANMTISTAGENPPFIADVATDNTIPVPTATLATMFPNTSPGNYATGPVVINQVNPRAPSQYIQEWNVAFQKSFRQAMSLQISYVGSKGTHLPFLNGNNIPTPGPGAIQARRPNTFFGEGFYLSNIGYSNYNSLQLTAQTLSWHGLYMLGSYTWGKSLDDMSVDTNNTSIVQDPNDLRAEYGISNYNLASRFTTALTYQLPFFATKRDLVRNVIGGWSLSSIITLQTGPVFTPGLSTDPANTGTTMRPNRIDHAGVLSKPTIKKWYDVAAFPVPAPYTYGDCARNVLIAPGLKDWDAALFKTFQLSRLSNSAQLQIRGEYFNLTNTPPFAQPDADVQDTTAGEVLSAGAPREGQVSAKIFF